jgi:hypothetical protein
VSASRRGPVAVVGAGGVGKAIAFALAALGVSEIRIFDSEFAKADRLAHLLAADRRIVVAESVEAALQGAVGLVNATPVGMLPSRGMPVPAALLHAGLWVADAVYSPLLTPLLLAAKAKGARVMTGRDLPGRRRLRALHGIYAVGLSDGRGLRPRHGGTRGGAVKIRGRDLEHFEPATNRPTRRRV